MEQRKKETKIGLERKRVREEQMQYITNFEETTRKFFMNDISTYFDYCLYEHSWYPKTTGTEKDYNNYYIRCFLQENYNREYAYDSLINPYTYVDCRTESIIEKLRKDRGQLKRALGLYLEYQLVKEFDLVPNTATMSRGSKGWDFKISKNKVDMKICFFRHYKKVFNKSVYNRTFVLDIVDLRIVLEYLKVNDEESEVKFRELLCRIKKTLDITSI